MANVFKYNPFINNFDIVGKSTPADGGGSKFVGVTGMLAIGIGNWARICQIQFVCDDIKDEDKKKNVCFDGLFCLTKQNANPYSFDNLQKSCKLDLHISIPYITDLSNDNNHYTRAKIAMLDSVNFSVNELELVETAHVISEGKAYVYCDLYAQLNTLFDRYFYSYTTNASFDQYNRIKIVPSIGEAPDYIPYGTGNIWRAQQFRADYTQLVTSVNSVVVNHYLNTYPNVVIIDENGKQCLADVEYNDRNMLTISFTVPFTGTIYCS